jgi:ABC-type spermidine/putrescine transport system permease subunit II
MDFLQIATITFAAFCILLWLYGAVIGVITCVQAMKQNWAHKEWFKFLSFLVLVIPLILIVFGAIAYASFEALFRLLEINW